MLIELALRRHQFEPKAEAPVFLHAGLVACGALPALKSVQAELTAKGQPSYIEGYFKKAPSNNFGSFIKRLLAPPSLQGDTIQVLALRFDRIVLTKSDPEDPISDSSGIAVIADGSITVSNGHDWRVVGIVDGSEEEPRAVTLERKLKAVMGKAEPMCDRWLEYNRGRYRDPRHGCDGDWFGGGAAARLLGQALM